MIYLTVICGLELAVILVLVAALLWERDALARILADWTRDAAAERARFLAAVQRPDLVQPVHAPKPPSKEEIEKRQRTLRELASVGTVTHADAGR